MMSALRNAKRRGTGTFSKALKSKKSGFLALLLLLSFITSPAASTSFATTQSDVEKTLICLCGCGQTIKDCPHENCSFAVPARKMIASLISEGKSGEKIVDIFVEKYGDEVLAAPRKEGFNLLGYIMPFAVILAAAALIIAIIKGWTARGIRDEQETLPLTKDDFGSDIDKKIEKELKEMD